MPMSAVGQTAAAIFKAFFALKLEIFYFSVVDDTIGNLICVSSFTIITIKVKVLVNFHHYLLFISKIIRIAQQKNDLTLC